MPRLKPVAMALAVVLSGVLVWPAAAGAITSDASDVTVDRYGGADRYATSLLIAEAVAAEAGGALGSVVLVSGERWTDAVVAAPIAGALGAPVLMTPPGELRADALAFLQRVGVADAIVVGPDARGGAHGPGRAVSAAVLDEMTAAGISARRVAAADKYSTSVAAANEITPGVMPGLGRTVIIASGEVFADALVAGPFAARGVLPVLLSAPDALPDSVTDYLTAVRIDHVVLMGGTAALGAAVESAVVELGANVTRLAGTTRYDTAVKAAELVIDRYSGTAGEHCFTTGTIGVARARVPFDSFSAAPLLGRLCAPLVLADPKQIPDDTAAFLDGARETNPTVDLRVFGGNAAVSQVAIDAYLSGEDSNDEPDGEASSESAAGSGSDCRPRGHSFSTGFPVSDRAAPSTGTLRVAVLFVDFAEAPADHSTRREAELGLSQFEAYLEAVSYGRLHIELEPHHQWLRAKRPIEELSTINVRGDLVLKANRTEHAVALADPDVDFSDTDAVLTVHPSTHFYGGGGGLTKLTADGSIMSSAAVNTRRLDEPRSLAEAPKWAKTAAHEFIHSLGLPDLYAYDRSAHTRTAAPTGQRWIRVPWGVMGLSAWYLSPENDPSRRFAWHYPSGSTTIHYRTIPDPQEMLAWSRWQLGWLDENQTRCIDEPEATVALAPLASPGGGIAMAAVQLNDREVIVVESRRKFGYDNDTDVTSSSGARAAFPNLFAEGILVYTVDVSIPNGQLPIKIAGDTGNGQVDDYPVLQAGETVTVRGYTITVTADDGDIHTVRIDRDG